MNVLPTSMILILTQSTYNKVYGKILYKWVFSWVLKFANVHCRPGSREFIFAVKYIQLSPKLTTCLN